MMVVALVIAGAVGAVARFVLDSTIKARWSSSVPWGTWLINVSGSLLLGLIAGLVTYRGMSADVAAVAGTGFCGGFTTFSTASFETVRLAQQRRWRASLSYALASVVASGGACAAGLALAATV